MTSLLYLVFLLESTLAENSTHMLSVFCYKLLGNSLLAWGYSPGSFTECSVLCWPSHSSLAGSPFILCSNHTEPQDALIQGSGGKNPQCVKEAEKRET